MRSSGMSYAAIGKHFGLTELRVHEMYVASLDLAQRKAQVLISQ